jgi:ABC-type spermidine/putrescine transport system permease subunit I
MCTPWNSTSRVTWRENIGSVGIQSFEIVRADKIQAAFRAAVHFARALLILVALFAYLDITLAQFPWTRALSRHLIELVTEPLSTIGRAVLAEIPNLVFLLILIYVSLHQDAEMTRMGLTQYARFLLDPFSLSVLGHTLWLGVEVTLLCLVLGFPMAWAYLRAPRWAQTFLILVILLPLLTSVVVRTFAWIVILGRQGIVNNAFVYACMHGHIDAAKLLLEKGAEINIVPGGFDYAGTGLHYAALNGHRAMVEFLLQQGADREGRKL